LRSPLNRQFDAAFWELYLHECLFRLGYSVTLHPQMPGTTRRPDFLAVGESQRFIIEARAIVSSDADESADRRIRVIYDALDTIVSPNFFVWIDVQREGTTPPPTRGLRRKLESWLGTLDVDAVSATMAQQQDAGALPDFYWQHDGWHISFRAVPKSAQTRGREGSRPLGIFGGGKAEWTDGANPLRKALREKGSAYGELDVPFVVALRGGSLTDDDYDLMNALYGTWQLQIMTAADGGVSTRDTRARDGFWVGPQGWRNSGVSAVLWANNIAPWTVANNVPTLWQHPDARHSIDVPSIWRRAYPSEGQMQFELPSVPISELFGLPSTWPPGEPFA
jgi:hypothetical protein